MPLVECPECSKTISDQALQCPNCGAPGNSAPLRDERPRAASCPKCNVFLVAVETGKSVSAAGLFGVLIAIFGLIALAFNVILGLIVIAIGIGISMLRGKNTVWRCPQCGHEGATLA